MTPMNGQVLLVLGLGDSGLAMARWCVRLGAEVRIWDSREQPPQAAALQDAAPGARLIGGPLDPARLQGEGDLADVRLLLKSPGLSPLDDRLAPFLAAARARGLPVQGELDLFARALAELKTERGYAPKVLAITGTNGKTTTTSLTARLVERTGLRVGLAGNIGPTMLDTLANALDQEPAPTPCAPAASDAPDAPDAVAVADQPTLREEAEQGESHPTGEAGEPHREGLAEGNARAGDADVGEPGMAATSEPDAADGPAADAADASAETAWTPPPAPPAEPQFEVLPQVWVLELSSFQLDGVQGFEPSAATVLNVTQDHLDWHGDLDAYTAAKARIFGSQAVMVINRDDKRVQAMVPAPVAVKGGRGRATRLVGRQVLRFGLDAPAAPGDFGLVVEAGMAWLVRALPEDETIKRRPGEEPEIHLQRLMPADALRIRGRHNASNALAALALASAIGCPLAPMLHGLREYRGEPHRVESIGSVGGVEAVDDSKGTNVGATVAALLGLGADLGAGRLVVILGGDGKGQDFGPLAVPVARHARAVATLGRDAAAIEAALAGSDVPLQRHASLPDAVRWCFAQAQPGDAVLLSPACASLDMFRNYAHRAEVFADSVRELALERGEVIG